MERIRRRRELMGMNFKCWVGQRVALSGWKLEDYVEE